MNIPFFANEYANTRWILGYVREQTNHQVVFRENEEGIR